jgi:hypothetical protein
MYVALRLLGVPFAVPLSVIVAFGELVPKVGVWIARIPLLTIAAFEGWPTLGLTFLFAVAVLRMARKPLSTATQKKRVSPEMSAKAPSGAQKPLRARSFRPSRMHDHRHADPSDTWPARYRWYQSRRHGVECLEDHVRHSLRLRDHDHMGGVHLGDLRTGPRRHRTRDIGAGGLGAGGHDRGGTDAVGSPVERRAAAIPTWPPLCGGPRWPQAGL